MYNRQYALPRQPPPATVALGALFAVTLNLAFWLCLIAGILWMLDFQGVI